MSQKLCLVKYCGGKQFLCNKILPYFPSHTTYVEPFGGAGTLLLNKEPSNVEVYNDINEFVVNLFRVVRDWESCKKMIRWLQYVPHSRQELYTFRKKIYDETDPIVKAGMYFYLLQYGYSSIVEPKRARFGFIAKSSNINPLTRAYNNKLDALRFVSSRLRYVTIEHDDFRKVISRYDTPYALFYVDPPYLPETRVKDKIYPYELSYDDHVELLEMLNNIKGKFILSGYDSELYNSYGWHRKSFHAPMLAGNSTNPNRPTHSTEVIWANFDLDEYESREPTNVKETLFS